MSDHDKLAEQFYDGVSVGISIAMTLEHFEGGDWSHTLDEEGLSTEDLQSLSQKLKIAIILMAKMAQAPSASNFIRNVLKIWASRAELIIDKIDVERMSR